MGSWITKGRTIRKVMGGGGERWGIFSSHEFFFRSPLVQEFFFQVNPSALIFFFFRQILLFFWTVKSWFIIYVFVLYKLFYTHDRSKDTGHFNAKSFRKCTHSERGGSHLEWTASLCIFLPSGIPLPQPIMTFIIMQYTLYVADSPAANETPTLWFLIFVKSTSGSVAVILLTS